MDVRAPEVAGGGPRTHCVLEDGLDGLKKRSTCVHRCKKKGLSRSGPLKKGSFYITICGQGPSAEPIKQPMEHLIVPLTCTCW